MTSGHEFKKLYKNPSIILSNIKDVYSKCTIDEFDNGKSWYKTANSFSLYLSDTYGVSERRSAAVIAVLSPLKEWEQNKKIAETFIQTKGKVSGHYIGQTEKGRSILFDDRTHQDIEKTLGGLKTINFFNNIFNPNTSEHVTVDRHHISLCTRSDVNTCTPKQYEFIKQNTIIFANELGIIPNVLQSTLWLCWKRLKKEKDD